MIVSVVILLMIMVLAEQAFVMPRQTLRSALFRMAVKLRTYMTTLAHSVVRMYLVNRVSVQD